MDVSSTVDIGTLVPLTTSGGNHTPEQWAAGTTSIIFDTSKVSAERMDEADKVFHLIVQSLTQTYKYVLVREQIHLDSFADHCDLPCDMSDEVDAALANIAIIGHGSSWADLLSGAEWQDAARATIGDHLCTAVHVERMMFADQHPDNSAAMAYKTQFNK